MGTEREFELTPLRERSLDLSLESATFSLSTNGGHGVIREILESYFNINLLKILY